MEFVKQIEEIMSLFKKGMITEAEMVTRILELIDSLDQ